MTDNGQQQEVPRIPAPIYGAFAHSLNAMLLLGVGITPVTVWGLTKDPDAEVERGILLLELHGKLIADPTTGDLEEHERTGAVCINSSQLPALIARLQEAHDRMTAAAAA